MAHELPVVAVFNTSPDTVQLLRHLFEGDGIVVVTAFTYEIRDGEVDLVRFMSQHRPQAIVYDIAPPYEPNWRLFQHLRSTTAMRDAQCVLTSTNAQHVQKMVGAEAQVFEFIGKPYDLEQILGATRRALRAVSEPEVSSKP
jgi:CheY-like chemotaxis protein